MFLGSVLAFAGTMKYLAITESSINPDLLGRVWWLGLAGLVLDAVLGLWLLTGVYQNTARWLCVMAFGLFAAFSLAKGVAGEASCGCFGALQVNPWVTFAFDLVCVALLVSTRPEGLCEGGGGYGERVLLAGVLVLGAGIGLSAYESVTRISRRLLVSETWHEFGETSQGQHLTHVFTLTNHCGYAVEIVESKVTCVCTITPNLSGHVIEPGGTLSLPLTLDTADAEEHLVGGVNLFCRRAGSTAAPTLFRRLQISAKVEADYWVRPMAIDLGAVAGGTAVKRRLRFRSNTTPAARVVGLDCAHAAVSVAVLAKPDEKGDTVIEVSFDADKVHRSGQIDVPVTGRTTSRNSPTFRMLVRATCRQPFEVSPTSVVIGSDVAGEAKRELTVRTSEAVRLEAVRAGPGFTAEILAADEAERSWRVGLRLPEAAHDGEVKLVLNGPRGERVVPVPVHRFAPRRP